MSDTHPSRFTFHASRSLVFLLMATLLIAEASAFDVIEIPDPNLRQAIREALNLPDEIPITQQEMLRLTWLRAMDMGITGLTGLEYAIHLKNARLDRNQISNLRPLAGLVNLEILELKGNQIVDISPLMNLANLERLMLIGNHIDDISPLAGLIRLNDLTLDENQIADLSPLMNLTNLTHLGLNRNQIDDVSPLANLTLLRNIGLSGNQINDISPLSGLMHLEGLGLNGNPIADISPLANLTNLKTLYLSGNKLINDITPLANLTQLMRLRLSGQSISDITPLADLTQLIHLRLDGNQVSDISPLANLTLLEELRLNRNVITDITPLIGLQNLKELRLADNPIHDFRPLTQLEGVELDIEIDLSKLDELNAIVEIPDPNLKQAIRDTLSLPEDIHLTKLHMQQLTRLSAWDSGITDLTGLEYATSLQVASFSDNQIHDLSPLAGLIHLEIVTLNSNPISDISPLANLTNLKHLRLVGDRRISDITPLANLNQLTHLNLGSQAISDITPLANLTQLVYLNLVANYIVDFTPLARLINLKELRINQNPSIDFTPLQGLNLTVFRYDEVCEIPPLPPPLRERIENRTFPSIFQSWDDVVGLDHLTEEQRIVLHDLYWHPRFETTIAWNLTPTEPTFGVGTSLAGPLVHAREVRQRRLTQNPNMVFLGGFTLHAHSNETFLPPDSDFWLRDQNGEIVRKQNGKPLINFLKSEVQDLFIKRIIAFEQCGLYDGVFFDGFGPDGTGFSGRYLYPVTDEEIVQAMLNIFRTARAHIREDFLILVNGTEYTQPRFKDLINGTMMEIGKDYPGGYTHGGLQKRENILSWAEKNLRSPQINCLQGQGMSIEPPDGPNNLRWMRVFTTMGLTHSDGYVQYTDGRRGLGGSGDHDHLWHDFWDADLGYSVGPKAQRYKDIPGLFIRKFTNGWAVYNRSGTAQTITLPAAATPVSDRGNNAASQTHLLPDLDGEIYLKIPNLADVNDDGNVNILDLIQVANAFHIMLFSRLASHGDQIPYPNPMRSRSISRYVLRAGVKHFIRNPRELLQIISSAKICQIANRDASPG